MVHYGAQQMIVICSYSLQWTTNTVCFKMRSTFHDCNHNTMNHFYERVMVSKYVHKTIMLPQLSHVIVSHMVPKSIQRTGAIDYKIFSHKCENFLLFVSVHACRHNSSWLASYIHACTNETHFIANLQDLIPTLALPIIIAAKVGIKSCRFAIECVSFVHAWM